MGKWINQRSGLYFIRGTESFGKSDEEFGHVLMFLIVIRDNLTGNSQHGMMCILDNCEKLNCNIIFSDSLYIWCFLKESHD